MLTSDDGRCSPLAAGAEWLDLVRVGHFGQQPPGAILFHHQARPKAVGARSGKLGTDGGVYRPRTGYYSVKGSTWLSSVPWLREFSLCFSGGRGTSASMKKSSFTLRCRPRKTSGAA